jgi:microcystin-dependent protein
MPAEPIMGQIMPFAGASIPRGWMPCNGAIMSISQNQGLFSVIGTAYGGDGIRTFALPDLRGRAILGSSGNNGQFPVGMVSGAETIKLTAAQIPAHNHLIKAKKDADKDVSRGVTPTGRILCKNTSPADNPTKIFSSAGKAERPLSQDTNIARNVGDQPHNNMQPYLVINYLIAIQGTYPSRS